MDDDIDGWMERWGEISFSLPFGKSSQIKSINQVNLPDGGVAYHDGVACQVDDLIGLCLGWVR